MKKDHMFTQKTLKKILDPRNFILKWGASSRWSCGLISEWNSIDGYLGKAHSSLDRNKAHKTSENIGGQAFECNNCSHKVLHSNVNLVKPTKGRKCTSNGALRVDSP